MTLPTFVLAQTAGNSNGNGLASISRGSTTTDDYNVLDMYYESGSDPISGAVTFSNGTWVLELSQLQIGTVPDYTHVRYREKYAGAGATFNITWNATIGTVWRAAIVTSYRGVDTTTPDDVAATTAASASSTASAIAPTLTTVTGDVMVVMGVTNFTGTTATPPAGFTERSDFGNVEVSDLGFATAGAVAAQTATVASASWNTASLIALRPAVAPGGGPPPDAVVLASIYKPPAWSSGWG